MDSLKFQGEAPALRKACGFVTINGALHDQFDQFKDNIGPSLNTLSSCNSGLGIESLQSLLSLSTSLESSTSISIQMTWITSLSGLMIPEINSSGTSCVYKRKPPPPPTNTCTLHGYQCQGSPRIWPKSHIS